MDIVRQLEQYRLERRIPQETLAKKLGVAFSTVNRWFNGKTKPSRIQQYHIEKLLRGPARPNKVMHLERKR